MTNTAPSIVAKKILVAFVIVASAVLAKPGRSQETPGTEPICLVLGYRTKPAERAALRSAVLGAGIAQFEKWKAAGVFADYDLFFSVLPGPAPTGDMTLVLRFNHFTDLAGWAKIEQIAAGGLPAAAQPLVESITSDLADLDWASPAARGPHDSLYVLFPYDLTSDPVTYKAYTTQKTVPQLDIWIKEGAITGYRMYMCHTESGGTWGSLLVMDYTGYKGLGSQTTVEPKVRDMLSKDLKWKAWLDRSMSLRTLRKPVIADKLNGD